MAPFPMLNICSGHVYTINITFLFLGFERGGGRFFKRHKGKFKIQFFGYALKFIVRGTS